MAMHQNHREGFSLIELIFATAIFASVIFVVLSLNRNLSTIENLISQKLQSRQDLDQTFQMMVTEIRSAGNSSLGGYAIDAASTSSFVFYSDVDADGLMERVRYFLSGTSTVMRGVIKPTGNPLVYASSSEILGVSIENVVVSTSTPIFSYYDASFTGTESAMTSTAALADIRSVKVSIYADIKPKTSPKPVFFTNTITIRNLRTN
jgi:prepilin-type N-terminal cleavage/methylation domain-containing protein